MDTLKRLLSTGLILSVLFFLPHHRASAQMQTADISDSCMDQVIDYGYALTQDCQMFINSMGPYIAMFEWMAGNPYALIPWLSSW